MSDQGPNEGEGLANRVDQLTNRIDHMMGILTQLTSAPSVQPPASIQPSAPQQAQGHVNTNTNTEIGEDSVLDIDPFAAVNAGEASRYNSNNERNSRRGSSLLVGIPELASTMRAAHAAHNARRVESQATTPAPMAVALEPARVLDGDKMATFSIRALRTILRVYRKHKTDYPHSRHQLGSFIGYNILKEIRANEMAHGTDLSDQLVMAEDLQHVRDEVLLRAAARNYRSRFILSKSDVGLRLYKEIKKLNWPNEYYDGKNNTWTIKPDGFHNSMFPQLLEWLQAMVEAAEFIYKDANRDDLKDRLPPISWGSKDAPGLIQMAQRAFGDLSDSLTALMTLDRLKLITDIREWQGMSSALFKDLATQSLALAQQKAQGTKPLKVDELMKRSEEAERKTESNRTYQVPPPRPQRYPPAREAYIHALEEAESNTFEEEEHTLALTETPVKSVKSDEGSMYYTPDYFGDEDDLFALTPGMSRQSALPCFQYYKEGTCKSGEACPYAKSHNRTMMEDRSRKIIKDVLDSKFGGKALISEVIHQIQANRNIMPSPSNQEPRHQGNYLTHHQQAITRNTPSPGSNETRFTHRELTPSGPEGNQPFSRPMVTNGGRDQNSQGRGGGRLVTYAGRGNMGRARYTNHIMQDDNQHDDENQVEEVSEGEQEESC